MVGPHKFSLIFVFLAVLASGCTGTQANPPADQCSDRIPLPGDTLRPVHVITPGNETSILTAYVDSSVLLVGLCGTDFPAVVNSSRNIVNGRTIHPIGGMLATSDQVEGTIWLLFPKPRTTESRIVMGSAGATLRWVTPPKRCSRSSIGDVSFRRCGVLTSASWATGLRLNKLPTQIDVGTSGTEGDLGFYLLHKELVEGHLNLKFAFRSTESPWVELNLHALTLAGPQGLRQLTPGIVVRSALS